MEELIPNESYFDTKEINSNKSDQLTPETRRTIIALALAQSILGSQMPMYIILGGLVGQSLASSSCYATLPISFIIIGSMLSSPLLSNLMQARTRRLGLFVGNLAFANNLEFSDGVKIGVLTGSLLSTLCGYFLLLFASKK